MRFEVGVPIVIAEPKGRIGNAFDDFLKDEGIFEEVQAGAHMKVVANRLGKDYGVRRKLDGLVDTQLFEKRLMP